MFGDLTTLTAIAGFVAVVSGAFLVVMGLRYQATSIAAVWGVGCVAAALALIVFAENEHFDAGFGCAVGAACLHWSALRLFARRQVAIVPIVAAFAVWAVIAFAPLGIALEHRVAAYQLILATLLFAGVGELWRARAERLSARPPMLGLVAVHGAVFFVGAVIMVVLRARGGEGQLSDFVPAIVETMIFCIGTSLFLVSMIRERRANEEKRAGGIDWLTGVPNRRAFLDAAEPVMAAAFASARPVAAIVFDLDHFKLINDTFGHRTGDGVIQRFAGLVARTLRHDDLVGRMGGEEFAVVLPGASREAAMALAERVRTSFAEEGNWVDGQAVGATVSAGVAVTPVAMPLHDLIDRADQALYAAKANGRDRVELSSEPVRPAAVSFA